jgi:DNA-binding GntR family transcriptional regulator/DNA-binding transcriptional regulator YiaG
VTAVNALPGWALVSAEVPEHLRPVLEHPGPLQNAYRLRHSGRVPAARALDQVRIRALAEVPRLLDVDEAAPLIRHREVLIAPTSHGIAGYTEARWPADRVSSEFVDRASRRGLAAALLMVGGRVEVLWSGRWTPVSDRALLGKVWRVVTPAGPTALVHDALAGLASMGPTHPTRHGLPPGQLGDASMTCLECGAALANLGPHLARRHQLSFAQYRIKHPAAAAHGASSAARALRSAASAEVLAEDSAWTAASVAALRRTLGVTLGQFAAQTGFLERTVADWERGLRSPGRDAEASLAALAATLDEHEQAMIRRNNVPVGHNPPLFPAPGGAATVVLGPLPTDRRPLDVRIAEQVGAAISAGHFAPGTALPSATQIAAHYVVSASTANNAIRRLAARGLVAVLSGNRTIVRRQPTGLGRQP